MKHPRPKIFISRCIEHEAVRYNGMIIRSEIVSKIMKYCDVITECPEVAIGMGIPRKPIRQVAVDPDGKNIKLIQPETGKDFTRSMRDFSRKYLESISGIDGFILKSKSPSSGFRDIKVYHSAGARSVLHKKGRGVFGGMVEDMFPEAAVTDEGRLNDAKLRDTFLKRIFLNAELRRVAATKKMKELVEFHTNNKYLFMCFSPKYLKVLGNIAANPVKSDFRLIIGEYRRFMNELLSVNYKYTSVINSLMHIFGYFKKDLGRKEKDNFMINIEKFKDGKISEQILLALLKSYAIRVEDEYILQQSIFEPYPEELIF